MDSCKGIKRQNKAGGEKCCRFCKGEITRLENGYFVCEKCEIVAFEGWCVNSSDKIYEKIKNYLVEMQAAILKKKDIWHDIEQRVILKQPISKNEQQARELLLEFQDLRCGLRNIINNELALDDDYTRNLLYRLLVISDDLEKLVNEDV